jgi:hypothetical protein
MTPAALSKLIVRKYIGHYKGSPNEVTQSACDLAKTPEFKEALTAMAAAMEDGLASEATRKAISYARSMVQCYALPDNVDLVDFCMLLRKAPAPRNIKDACDGVIDAIRGPRGLVVASGSYGSAVENSHGLSVYFPTRNILPTYGALDFPEETGWTNFLKEYINAIHAR